MFNVVLENTIHLRGAHLSQLVYHAKLGLTIQLLELHYALLVVQVILIQIEVVGLLLIAKHVVLVHLTPQVKIIFASLALKAVTIQIQGCLLACFVMQVHITHLQGVHQFQHVNLA